MAFLWNKICEMFHKLVRPTKRRTRVKFTPSTLLREMKKDAARKATRNPFFNFLTRLRLHENYLCSESQSSTELAKNAAYIWRCMSEKQKAPYRNIALQRQRIEREHRTQNRVIRHRRRHFHPMNCHRMPIDEEGTESDVTLASERDESEPDSFELQAKTSVTDITDENKNLNSECNQSIDIDTADEDDEEEDMSEEAIEARRILKANTLANSRRIIIDDQ